MKLWTPALASTFLFSHAYSADVNFNVVGCNDSSGNEPEMKIQIRKSYFDSMFNSLIGDFEEESDYYVKTISHTELQLELADDCKYILYLIFCVGQF